MMCDTNWCTFCDSAISPYSDSLYCSEDCLRQDALMHHPMLGYDYAELSGFPHPHNETQQQLPSLVRRKTSIAKNSDFTQLQKIPSLSPSLSSSVSSYSSTSANNDTKLNHFDTYFHPKPRKVVSSTTFMEQLNQALLLS